MLFLNESNKMISQYKTIIYIEHSDIEHTIAKNSMHPLHSEFSVYTASQFDTIQTLLKTCSIKLSRAKHSKAILPNIPICCINHYNHAASF